MRQNMRPAFEKISPVNINGIGSQRLMIVLATPGCEYARKNGGGCTVCGFFKNARQDITEQEIVGQLDYSLINNDMREVRQIDLLTLGSFLNNNEVAENTRRILLRRIAGINNILRVSFESRAEHVAEDKLRACKDILDGRIVEFGIGLESADNYIRNKIIKKGLTRRDFEKTVRMLKNSGYDLLVYLLIKPPYLSERRAIEDAVRSAEYVSELANRYGVSFRIAFEPVFVCSDTPLEVLFEKAEYRLVNLWSVVEVIKRTHQYGPLFIGMSDENLSRERMAHSCIDCSQAIRNEVEFFNKTQDISGLMRLHCRCKEKYEYELEAGLI